MAGILVDEDMSRHAARILRGRGHDAVAVTDQLLRHSPDHLVLWTAVAEGRLVVTHNRGDFQLLHGAWRDWNLSPPHFGVLVIPQHFGLSAEEIADAVTTLLESRRPLRNEFYLLGRDGAWTQPSV